MTGALWSSTVITRRPLARRVSLRSTWMPCATAVTASAHTNKPLRRIFCSFMGWNSRFKTVDFRMVTLVVAERLHVNFRRVKSESIRYGRGCQAGKLSTDYAHPTDKKKGRRQKQEEEEQEERSRNDEQEEAGRKQQDADEMPLLRFSAYLCNRRNLWMRFAVIQPTAPAFRPSKPSPVIQSSSKWRVGTPLNIMFAVNCSGF